VRVDGFCKDHAPAFEFIDTAREEKPGLWRGECYSQSMQTGFVAWVDLNANIRNGRYTMHTIDGGVIARFDCAQTAGDAMAYRLRMGSKPAPGYVFDSAPDRAFPFTVYMPNFEGGPITHTGTQCKDFAEVCKVWGRK
jgi:hypothetical protein